MGIRHENATVGIVRKFCLFCRKPLTKSTATNEHVIPQWLLRQFGIGDRTISPAGWQWGNAPSRRSHPWSRLVVRDVCVNCNSGWLSELENAAKPFLPALAAGQRPLGALTDEENLLLARWAAKTAFLIQRTAGIPAVIPMDAFCALRDEPGGLPASTFVFGFQDDGDHPFPINGLQTQDWTVHAPYEDAIETTAAIRTTCKISLRLGRLHLLVAYFGASGLEPVGWHRVHHPVFPRHCRLWINAGFKIGRVTQREESSMVLFQVALGAAMHCSPEQIARRAPPVLEELHEHFFDKYKHIDLGRQE
ncbi:MAG TPA: hypothetical protein VEU96_02640 [Bryobacteraceae bacterium]|nr:hypothetical protein [Bryobacteraceae bacterium]